MHQYERKMELHMWFGHRCAHLSILFALSVFHIDIFFLSYSIDILKFHSSILSVIGDVPQPIIKVRGNRAYFCKWFLEATAAHEEMVAIGMTNSTDLFEVVY